MPKRAATAHPPPKQYVDSCGTRYEYGHRAPWGVGLYRLGSGPDATPVQDAAAFAISQQRNTFTLVHP